MTPGFPNDDAGLVPVAPVPAASEPSDRSPLPEKELLRQLLTFYPWHTIGPFELRRVRPQGPTATVQQVRGLIDEAA